MLFHIEESDPVRIEQESNFPLSYAQQRLWFIDQLEPESAAYNMPLAVRLEGELKVEAVGRALAEVVRRHEVLRTRFVLREGQAAQVIEEQWGGWQGGGDGSGLARGGREKEMQRLGG